MRKYFSAYLKFRRIKKRQIFTFTTPSKGREEEKNLKSFPQVGNSRNGTHCEHFEQGLRQFNFFISARAQKWNQVWALKINERN